MCFDRWKLLPPENVDGETEAEESEDDSSLLEQPEEPPKSVAKPMEVAPVAEDEEVDAAAIIAKAKEDAEKEEDYKAKDNQSYYSIAHCKREKITVQPSILVNGTLKPYQVIKISFS